MANTSLRQIPHSSTLSDLLGDWNGRRDETQPRLPESHSENRIAGIFSHRSLDFFKISIITFREKTVAEECLVELLVRFYLENKDQQITKFLQEFAVLNAQDEKTDALSRTLTAMYSRLSTSTMWRDAPESMVSYAKKTLERVMMARIHVIAFYPNLDADRHRDELLFKSLSKLSRAITPDHPMLRIPSIVNMIF
uniref:DUF5601 domain-containing protein n=1 Tax=Heterorhabditis bacteriophora TaxID=37862 RepID=A0A1I7X3X2_HETBA